MRLDSAELRGGNEVVFSLCIQTQGPPFDEARVMDGYGKLSIV